jgi:uncharacterized membrane protein YbhN (UPF0104 family)
MPRLSLLLRLVGLLLFLGIAFWALDGEFLLLAFAQLSGVGILASVFAVVLTISLGALRWGVLLYAIGCRPGAASVAAASCIGNALNILLPTGVVGDLVKVLVIGHQEQIPLSELFGTVAIDRILGLTGFICIAAVTLLTTEPLERGGTPLTVSPAFLGLLLIAVGVSAALVIMTLDRRLPPGRTGWRKMLAALSGVFQTVYAYRCHSSALAWGFVISLLSVLSVCVAIWFLALPFAIVSPFVVVLAVTASALIALLPVTVNGLGSRDLVFVLVLGGGGLTAEQAVALSLAWFAVTLVVSAGLSGLSLSLFPHLVSLTRLRALLNERRRQAFL